MLSGSRHGNNFGPGHRTLDFGQLDSHTTGHRPNLVGTDRHALLNVDRAGDTATTQTRKNGHGLSAADTLPGARYRVSVTDMKSGRRYEMRARADTAAATADNILAAARAWLGREPYDAVTLDDVAADAGVTVQTVLRRFGSKEGLVRAVGAAAQPGIIAQRDEAPSGDPVAAIANLVEHYELLGDEVLHLLRQEQRVPAFAEIVATGRDYHAQWVKRVFAPWLAQRSGTDRARLHAQLVAVCDVYTWYLLRRQAGLSRRATTQAIGELVEGILP